MNTQTSPAYKAAWKNYQLNGNNLTRLSAADVAALRSDDVTRKNLDAPGPVHVTTRTKVAEVSPQELGDAIAHAFHATVENGDAAALHDLDENYATDKFSGGLIQMALLRAAIGELHRLHRKVKELETRPALKYQGTYDGTRRYGIGDIITDHGSAWIAKVPTEARPGFGASGSRDWQLFVKKGSDGRDGKDAAS